MSATEQITETGNEYDNLVRLLHDALQGAETCKGYVLEAEGVGNYQFADFFAEVQRMHESVAERAKGMLGDRGTTLRLADARLSGTYPIGDPDPGDVSSGQDDTPPAKVSSDLPRSAL
jgi:hypothetical protein